MPSQENIELDPFVISNSSETVYTRASEVQLLPEQEDGETGYKRLKTNILTYISQNYLFIIKTLLCVVVILGLTLTITIILSQHKPITTELAHKPTTSRILVTATVPTATAVIQPAITTVAEVQPAIDSACGRINCRTVKPNDLLCYVDELTYRAIKIYTCCDCLPPGYTFIRYVKDRNSATTSLLFKVDGITPRALSELDLKVIPPLKNLRGQWNVIEESDIANWLSFSILKFDTPPEE